MKIALIVRLFAVSLFILTLTVLTVGAFVSVAFVLSKSLNDWVKW